MSDYTNTGKKVKSINYDSIDFTYNDVYEVFIDNDGDEFIIDNVGDKRYGNIDDNRYYELVDDTVDTTNDIRDTTNDIRDTTNDIRDTTNDIRDTTNDIRDTTNDIRDTNETKLKFKVGDKVKVVDDDYISVFTDNVKVGYTGIINLVDNYDNYNPYRVKLDELDVRNEWWFTDKCIELVNDDTDTIENNPAESAPIVSDGGSSSYYEQQIPKGMLERFNTTGTIEAKDVIRLFLGNDFNMGNIFKAYCRVTSLRNGKGKAGIDEQYDLTKAKYFTEDELNYYLENKE